MVDDFIAFLDAQGEARLAALVAQNRAAFIAIAERMPQPRAVAPAAALTSSAYRVVSEGRRHYIEGNTYAVKDQIKNAGCHWDPDRRAWWIGSRDKALAIVAKLPKTPPPAPPRAPSRYSARRGYSRSSYGNTAPGGRRCSYCGSRSCAKAWNDRDLCDED